MGFARSLKRVNETPCGRRSANEVVCEHIRVLCCTRALCGELQRLLGGGRNDDDDDDDDEEEDKTPHVCFTGGALALAPAKRSVFYKLPRVGRLRIVGLIGR